MSKLLSKALDFEQVCEKFFPNGAKLHIANTVKEKKSKKGKNAAGGLTGAEGHAKTAKTNSKAPNRRFVGKNAKNGLKVDQSSTMIGTKPLNPEQAIIKEFHQLARLYLGHWKSAREKFSRSKGELRKVPTLES